MRAAGSTAARFSSPSERTSEYWRAAPRHSRQNSRNHETRNHHHRPRPCRDHGHLAIRLHGAPDGGRPGARGFLEAACAERAGPGDFRARRGGWKADGRAAKAGDHLQLRRRRGCHQPRRREEAPHHRHQHAGGAERGRCRRRRRSDPQYRTALPAIGAVPAQRQLGGARSLSADHRHRRQGAGVLGLGRIGEAIVKRVLTFGMKIRYHNRNRKDVPYPYDPDAATLAKNSDVLLVVTPGGPETNKLVDAKVLDALGPQGYLVNIARGSVIDEPVLLRYLQEKRIAGAGLDVFADEPRVPPEFFTLDNAVLFPHVGSATVETRKAMGDLQIENLRLHFAGKPVKTRVV